MDLKQGLDGSVSTLEKRAARGLSGNEEPALAGITTCMTRRCSSVSVIFRPDGGAITNERMVDLLESNGWVGVKNCSWLCPNCHKPPLPPEDA
jgi:hypothetical protein